MNRQANLSFLVLLFSCFFASPAQSQVGRGAFGFGLSANANMLQSDWKSNDPGAGGAVNLSYSLGSNWGLFSRLGFDNLYGKNFSNQYVLSTTFSGDLGLTLDLLPSQPFNPFVYGGAGLVFFYPRVGNGPSLLVGKDHPWDIGLVGGLGIDYYVSESWSIIVSAEAVSMLGDTMDGYPGGKSDDQFERVSIGVRYYLFDRSAVQRIVDAVQKQVKSE